MTKRSIMVTGGSAVAGDGLRAICQSEYPGAKFLFPSSRECNLLELGSIRNFLVRHRPDAIIHFATVSGGIQLTLEHPASVLRDNLWMNLNIVEGARLEGVGKVVMTMSAAIYPQEAPVPTPESWLHLGHPHSTNYSYAYAKRMIEPMIRAYRHEFGLELVAIIPGAILGPRSNFHPGSSTAVPGMIRRFHEQRTGTGPLTVWGDGTPRRQFTADQDVGRIAMWCLDNYSGTDPLNISTMEEVTIGEAARWVAEALELDIARIHFDPSKPNGSPRQATDNAKFLELSGFQYVPARETIRRTAEYFRRHYPDPTYIRL